MVNTTGKNTTLNHYVNSKQIITFAKQPKQKKQVFAFDAEDAEEEAHLRDIFEVIKNGLTQPAKPGSDDTVKPAPYSFAANKPVKKKTKPSGPKHSGIF